MIPYTHIAVTGGCLGTDTIQIRCRLAQADSPVEIDYREGEGWQPTCYCANDCGPYMQRLYGLMNIARELAAQSVGASIADAHACWLDMF